MAAAPTTSPAQRLAAEQIAFDQAPDPVAKAKALAKLEPAVFDSALKTLDSGDDVGSLAQLERFRDETKATVAALQTVSAHAQDHPAGFKELQIALREAVRHMDGIILDLPPDKHPWFRAVRSDLVESQNELIDILFPRQQRKVKAPSSWTANFAWSPLEK
ncbi:MAG: hypothetical protein WA871_06230 [Candidatus Acidiferrales bacterium]